MDTASDTLGGVVADVVLHRAEVRQTQTHHLRTLPVLLEPAAVIAMNRQIEHQKPRDVRLRDLQLLLEIKRHTRSLSLLLVLGLVAAFAGSHHARFSVYHSIVRFRPFWKSVCVGSQPSSVLSFVESIA